MPSTKVMTFLDYKSLFSNIEKDGILIPISYLKEFNNVESLIDYTIKSFDNHEAISYSSFLNTIAQTCSAEESERLGLNEMMKTKMTTNIPKNGILFHRDNLLFMIEKAITKEAGDLKITGQKTYNTAREYYKALLLISEIIPDTSLEKDHFIRAYPYYYIPQTAETIYELRLQRYWYIYNNLLEDLDDTKKNHLQTGIQEIEKKANLSLKDYFHVVVMIYYWFLKIPNLKKTKDDEELKKLGFNNKNIDSFYIRKGNFGKDHDILKLISHLSLSIEEFKEKIELNSKRRDPIEGFYRNFQTFFDHPIFKIDDDNYCLIDFKFLIEGLCSGFMWHINAFSDSQLQSVKEQYGYLLEIYFVELLKKIFGENNVQKPEEDGNPDVILETDDYVIILEFTTEYYRFASLYSENTDLLKEDLYRILFNKPLDGDSNRSKKDKGKFIKLDGYLESYKNSKKTIIPVLVTENYLGDFDLLDRFDGFISDKINSNKLCNLKGHKPTIVNLDDFELFWQIANSENTINQFAHCVSEWEKNKAEKGKYHFNFSFFVSEINKDSKVNTEFSSFFNFQSFMQNLNSN